MTISRRMIKSLMFFFILISFVLIFTFTSTGLDAAFAWGPPGQYGNPGYTFTQSSMVTYSSLTTYTASGHSYGASANNSLNANQWHLENTSAQSATFVMTIKLSDNLYHALLAGKLTISTTTTAEGKNENIVADSTRIIKAFISLGNISGSGLGRDDFTQTAYATGNESSKTKKDDGSMSTTATYSGSSGGQYIRYGITAFSQSTKSGFPTYSTAKGQINSINMTLTLSANGDSTAPTISGTNNAFTASNAVTLTDDGAKLWKYTINGGGGTTYGANTSSATITLSQGSNTIMAYDNLGNYSTKTIKYYNPTVYAQNFLNGSSISNTTPGTIKIGTGTAGYTVSASGQTVGGSHSLVAAPNDGYYLESWQKTTGTSITSAATTTIYTIAEGDAYTTPIYWQANFKTIATPNKTVTYNALPHAIEAVSGLPSGFSVQYLYTGENTAGTSYNSSNAPVNAGQYNCRITIKNSSGQEMGYKNVDLIINRVSDITISLNPLNAISYGQILNRVILSGRVSYASGNIEGSLTWVNGNEMPQISTTKEYNYKFTPTGADKNNFQTEYIRSINVTVNCNISVEGIDNYTALEGELWSERLNAADFNANTKPINLTTAQVSVTASPYTNGNYVFLGWMKNGTYVTKDLIYTYNMPNESTGELNATLRAVFVKLNVEGLVNLSYGSFKYDKYYTGAAEAFNFTSPLPSELYKFEFTPMVYTQGSGFPIAIGSETATFSIRNTQLGVNVFDANIQINIVENIVSVQVDQSNSIGYNALTGWGETIYYIISVPGVLRGKITKYQYRLEGESVWHDVINMYNAGNPTTTPQNQNGCPVRFEAGSGAIGESSVRKYYFKAVNNEHGTTPSYYAGNKSVASSASYTATKIDRITPQLSLIAKVNDDIYSGNWTNGNVTFVFTASFGGSGAQINYSNNAGASKVYTNTGATPGYNIGDSNTISQNVTFTWTISSEQMTTSYYFCITSGTNKTIEIEFPIVLKIDKTKPNISEALLNINPNSNGWIGQAANASFTVSEQTGWSGIKNITVSSDASLVINSGAGIHAVTNSCILVIKDYKEYTVTAIDNAGNVQTKVFRYKVDTMVPELSIEEGSYVAGEWINTSAIFNLLAQTGASGVKFFYRFGAGSFLPIGNGEFVYEGDGSKAFQDVRTAITFAEEMNRDLSFRVETGAGHTVTMFFGAVKLDYTDPTVGYITDMGYYQTGWRNEPVLIEFFTRDDASGIAIDKVIVNNDATVSYNGTTSEGFPKFIFQINKCTPYTATVYDIAGNVKTLEFIANVDIGIPEMDYEAYIGSTSEVYNFDKWINRSTYGDDAFVRFFFYMTISPSGAKIQYQDASRQWKDLTNLMWEEGKENELVQYVECEVDIKTDQNGPLMIRLATGSGKYTEAIDLGTVMIDSTLPYFSTEPVFTDANNDNAIINDFQTNWTYKVVKSRFIPYDQTSGITSVAVFRYEISDTGFTNGTQINCQKEATTNYYSFLMDRYAFYELVLTDGSGNIHKHSAIKAMVDTTNGFSLDVIALKDGLPYVTGDWLQQVSDAVDFQLQISFDNESGYTGFGASGGGAQFSVDGGKTWITSLTLPDGIQTLNVDPYDPLKASMNVVLQQMQTYRFRVTTGAGRIYEVGREYLIRKDIVNPSITYVATVQGNNYESTWTAKDVHFTFTISIGASDGIIKMVTSSTPIEDLSAEDLIWTTIKTVTQGYNTQHLYTVNSTVDNLYYYFKLEAGTGKKQINPNGKLLKIDKNIIAPTMKLYKGEDVFAGGWSDNELRAVLDTLPNIISGYNVYYAVDEVGQTSNQYFYIYADDNGIYQVNLAYSERMDIRFKVVNGAGEEFVTPVSTYGIDLILPTFDIDFNNEAPKVLDPANPNLVWYLSDVHATYKNSVEGISGITKQYSVYQNGEWSEWTSEGIQNDTLVLRDTSISGGTIINIRFRIISGAGKYTESEYTAHIDDNLYEVNLVQYVGSTEGLSYAQDVVGVMDRQRGGSLTISFKEASGYRLKYVYVGNAYYARTFSDNSENSENLYSGEYGFDYYYLYLDGKDEYINITVGGSDVEVYLYFIKDITLKYSNLEQHKQNNIIKAIGIEVDEYGFYQNYANEILAFQVLYNGSVNVPNEIGVYNILVTTSNTDFNIVNPDYYTVGELEKDLQLIVKYYSGYGDTYDSYIIYNYQDLSYINIYMDTSEEYDYLGFNRVGASFRINNDIELPSDFSPLCATIDKAFQGYIYGQNNKIFYPGTFEANGDFGLLLYVINGLIFNLGIEYDLNINPSKGVKNIKEDAIDPLEDELVFNQEGVSVGFLVARALLLVVYNSYAYGNITVKGVTEVNIGGIVGRMEAGVIYQCFADIHINAKNVLGNIGGIAGGIFAEVGSVGIVIGSFSVSQITVDNLEIGAILGHDYFAGSYIGWLKTEFSSETIEEFDTIFNYYLSRSLFNRDVSNIDTMIQVISIGIGNEGVKGYNYSLQSPYEFFLDIDLNIGDEELAISDRLNISSLSRMRIRKAGFGNSDGTAESPFSVSDGLLLKHVETFPWAHFEQITNIAVANGAKTLSTRVPFMGAYNGGGYDLRCNDVEFEGSYGGLFGMVLGGVLENIKLIGINIKHTATNVLYFGGLVGSAVAIQEDAPARLNNIVVSGTIEINAQGHDVYVGGIVGAINASTMTDCVSMVNITVINAANAHVGGIIAQAQNATSIINIISLANIGVHFTKNGFVGSSIGSTHDSGVRGQKVYNVEGSTYVNGRIYDAAIGSNRGQVQEIYKRSYSDTVSAAGGVTVGQKSILELIAGLYPFDGGTGTRTDPFRVSNYKQLLKINNYMYANFVITNDIVIGDTDGDANGNGIPDGKEPGGVATPDGVVDEFDDYDYSFKSLGNGGNAFTGSIESISNTNNQYYSISGLTAPLFEINKGTISNLTLNLSYRQYASEDSVPVGVKSAIVDNSGLDTVYGGVAKYNYPGGKINSITVGGTVIIQTAGKAKVKAGGIVGIAYGGSMKGCLNAVDMRIDALVIDAGGIVGSLEGNTVIIDSYSGGFEFNYNYTVASIRVNGGSVKAGLVVGAVRFENVELHVEAADTSAKVYINGVDKGSERLIGYSIN